jgi:hypothetical protein
MLHESKTGELWEEVCVPTHRLKDARWVAVVVEIKENATGVVREVHSNEILNNDAAEPNDFIWDEGNCSCDCNRRLFFARAGVEPESKDVECSWNKFSVRLRNKYTGRVYYDEFDEVHGS